MNGLQSPNPTTLPTQFHTADIWIKVSKSDVSLYIDNAQKHLTVKY